ncbi:MAG: hypothetical protein ABIK65_10850 [Candidatus Eisenbacteria bacterium]
MRRVLTVILLAAVAASLAAADDLRRPPAPDDLLDPDLIELDLDAIIAEQEKLWSVSFQIGTAQKDLATTETQAENIVTIKAAYDNLADEFEDATGISIRWQKDSFDPISPVFDLFGTVRYKLPESILLPGVGSRLGVELSGGRTGTATRFSELGFGASLSDEVYVLSGRALFYMPASLTFNDYRLFQGVEKREVYFGLGFGRAWANHAVEIYSPAASLSGIGEFYHFEADGSTNIFEVTLGLEEYFTPSLSVNFQVGYQSLKQDELKYADVQKVEDADILINEGEVATVWGPWFPEGSIPFIAIQSGLDYGWDTGTENIVVDFSGFNFKTGLRYHF